MVSPRKQHNEKLNNASDSPRIRINPVAGEVARLARIESRCDARMIHAEYSLHLPRKYGFHLT